ncbi:hypothetical protein L1987_08295 [Smallanthus sonchifolius]|uniref:Uncharacterized protein n=1 Tax=Smallanthus sonchifolius TaxID=185202 RepID=A0ACB9JK84_9ASTR|nr:hypothetical protein L1987_08295 [Smallanthus sonchifolius]
MKHITDKASISLPFISKFTIIFSSILSIQASLSAPVIRTSIFDNFHKFITASLLLQILSYFSVFATATNRLLIITGVPRYCGVSGINFFC